MGNFEGYDTSDEYLVQAVWPVASQNLRAISKTRNFILRGRGRVLQGKETPEGRIVEIIVDIPHPKRSGTDPLVVRISGSYMTSDDGEWAVHMESPFFTGTHGSHAKMTGDPAEDATNIAQAIADMVDDMRNARPGVERSARKTRQASKFFGEASVLDAVQKMLQAAKLLNDVMKDERSDSYVENVYDVIDPITDHLIADARLLKGMIGSFRLQDNPSFTEEEVTASRYHTCSKLASD